MVSMLKSLPLGYLTVLRANEVSKGKESDPTDVLTNMLADMLVDS